MGKRKVSFWSPVSRYQQESRFKRGPQAGDRHSDNRGPTQERRDLLLDQLNFISEASQQCITVSFTKNRGNWRSRTYKGVDSVKQYFRIFSYLKPYSEKQKINQQWQPPLDQCCVHLYAQTSDLKLDWHWLLSILSPLFRSQQEL